MKRMVAISVERHPSPLEHLDVHQTRIGTVEGQTALTVVTEEFVGLMGIPRNPDLPLSRRPYHTPPGAGSAT